MVMLHAYVLRELLKTFLLTLLAITALLTMGGGLFNAIRFQGLSASDVFRFVPYLFPIVMTIAMPVAALFAATMVYGRLAADNELVACRAAGINVHRLFASVVLLAAFVALLTLLFASFLIPGFVRELEDYTKNNIRDLLQQTLQNKGFVHYAPEGKDQITLTAERVQTIRESALAAKGFETGPGLHYLQFVQPTVMRRDAAGKLELFAVARYGMCIFDVRTDPVRVTLLIREGRQFEIGKQAAYVEQQAIGPYEVDMRSQRRLSVAAMDELFRWREAPWQEPRLADEVDDFLVELTRERFFEYCRSELAGGGDLVLYDDAGLAYRIHCAGTEPGKAGLLLTDVRIVAENPRQPRPTRYEAPRAELIVGRVGAELILEMRLMRTAEREVLEYNPRAADPNRPRPKSALSLGGALVPEDIRARVTALPPAALFEEPDALDVGPRLGEKLISLQRSAERTLRKIKDQIHFRLAYMASVLVTALMGAALGVMFRGARALAAFALALIPFVSVIILMFVGRQLTLDERTTHIGPFVTWGGLVAALVADGVILRFGVRR